jgi:hypothetical protein
MKFLDPGSSALLLRSAALEKVAGILSMACRLQLMIMLGANFLKQGTTNSLLYFKIPTSYRISGFCFASASTTASGWSRLQEPGSRGDHDQLSVAGAPV